MNQYSSITPLLEKTQQSAAKLRALSDVQKQELLVRIAELLGKNKGLIISENKKDLDRMDDANPKKDRLLLNEKRIDGLITALHDVAKLGDPSGKVLSSVVMENRL
ncbi:MAG: gamma-glutamyl-phosphate reductase, partial [Cytophagales bacterium]|nr:gamma-glutamyl-phosphate reductase [Cytophagales bacterium]